MLDKCIIIHNHMVYNFQHESSSSDVTIDIQSILKQPKFDYFDVANKYGWLLSMKTATQRQKQRPRD